jgi:nicotinamidase-related amidase
MLTMHRDRSILLTIDIQGRLAPAIAGAEQIIAAANKLLQVSTELTIPSIITEQYPQGLGPTIAALQRHTTRAQCYEKIHFSAYREQEFVQLLKNHQRQQLVVMGTESYVCVLQTVLDVLAAGYQVFVVSEAVGSRTAENKALALQRMAAAGATIVSVEMVLFEWLERAGTERFRHISKTFIR